MAEKNTNENLILKVLKVLGILCLIVAAVLIAVIIVMQINSVREKYDQYLYILEDFENKVASLKNHWLIMIVIFLLYILRSLSAMYPYAVIYIITGMVFPPVQSFLINTVGMAFTIAFRYYTGIQMGEGYLNNVLKKYPAINSALEVDGRGNPIVLFALRLVPVFPFNTVSQLYGTFEYPFVKYLLISVAALIPRLITYSFIGNNVYDPLSTKFFVPIIILLFFSAGSFFFLRGVLGLTFKYSHKKRKDPETHG